MKKTGEYDVKRSMKTDRQKKAEAEMMKTLLVQYVSESIMNKTTN
jgi:hypothetical protein